MIFEKIVTEKLSSLLEGNCLLSPSQFSYPRGLETNDALLTLSHHLQITLDRGMEGRFVQLDFSAAFNTVSHCGMLYKRRSIGVGERFFCIVYEFFSD